MELYQSLNHALILTLTLSAPAIIAAPTGPPTPVHMTATPAATMAPAAMYSQLSDSQFPAALAAFCSIPFEACW